MLYTYFVSGLILQASAKDAEYQEGNANFPNIILLMADDLGWGDTGYNGNSVIKTPHLDEMAREGVQFNRFYSASAVCSPTRASVLTGRNPHREGVFHANDGILRPEAITLAELVKAKGYVTGIFGKWHLGTLTHTEHDSNRGRPGNIKEYNPPALHGFDSAFVTEAKVPTYDPMKKPVDRYDHKGWSYLREGEAYEDYGTAYWDIYGEKVSENLSGDDSRVIMDRVIPFIDQAVDADKPFLAVVWFHTPHLPVVAGPKYHEMYKGESELMRNYAGSITAMDKQIGRLLSFLDEKGEASNTMLWFCSDNGPEVDVPGSTGGFRERKRSLHEGGIRVPGLLLWPEKIPVGFQTDMPAGTVDYLPTILDALGISETEIPYELDGISLLPLLESKSEERSRPLGFLFQNQASYSGNQYKLYSRNGEFSLYDIIKDPFETTDIADSELILMRRLKQELMELISSSESSFRGNEYGTESFDRLEQGWVNPLEPAMK